MTQVTQYLTAGVFVMLTGAVCIRCGRDRRSSRTSGWAAATFGCFAVLLVSGLISRSLGSDGVAGAWIARATITLLVLFPWLMFRFAEGFRRPTEWFRRLALLVTALVVIWGWLLPGYGDAQAKARTPIVMAYLLTLLIQWMTLLIWVGFRLWRAGRHEPPVAQKRVQLLAVAAVILAADLLIAIVVPSAPNGWLALCTQVLALASGLLFYAGLVPPRWLRSIWRRSTDTIWERAVYGVVAAGDITALRTVLLPAAIALVGGSRGAILTPTCRYEMVQGKLAEVSRHCSDDDYETGAVATAGLAFGEVESPASDTTMEGAAVSASVGADTLVVWASPFAVFFGDEEHRLLQLVGSFADLAAQRLELSERVARAVDRQLRDTRAASEAVLESAGEAIITFDDAGRIVTANPAAERLFREPSARLVNHLIMDLFPEVAEVIVNIGARVERTEPGPGTEPAEDGASLRLDAQARTADGHAVPVEMTLTQVALEGQRLQICVARDVSERRQAAEQLARRAEELARSNAELQQFAYVASHDLQEPLRKVANYVQVLAADYADQLDDQAREYIHFAADGAQRMRRLIEDLLAVSRVRVDRMQIEECDTRAIVNAILEDFEVALADADATVTVGDLPIVPGDPTHLRQALQNLISNAVKYRSKAPLEIDIQAEPEPRGWLFTVQDNGIGFKQEYADQIFGMFQRLVSRRQYEGTGMGLAIVAKAIQNHGGEIWARSQPGGPTVLSFRLPSTPSTPDLTTIPPASTSAKASYPPITPELSTTGALR
jgi:PAS domain S-box-containing protein